MLAHASSLRFRMLTSQLPGIGRYVVKVSATCAVEVGSGTPPCIAELHFVITLVSLPPVAQLHAPSVAASQCEMQLDASGSFDPRGLPLTFAWNCTQTETGPNISAARADEADQACRALALSATASSSSGIVIAGNQLTQGLYIFTVNVSSGGAHPASALDSKTVDTRGTEKIPSISLDTPPSRVSPQKSFHISASATESAECPVPDKWSWWLLSTSDSHTQTDALNLTSLSTPNNHAALTLPSLPVSSGTYRVRLALSSSVGATWKGGNGIFLFDTEPFEVSPPPCCGRCDVYPKEGIELVDEFTISAVDWQDQDLPLQYMFEILRPADQDGLSTWSLLSDWSMQASVKRIFMAGNTSVRALVMDSLGSISKEVLASFIVHRKAGVSSTDAVNAVEAVAALADPVATVATIEVVAAAVTADNASRLLSLLNNTDVSQDGNPQMLKAYSAALVHVVDSARRSIESSASQELAPVVNVAFASQAAEMVSTVARTSAKGLEVKTADNLLVACGRLFETAAQATAGDSSGSDDGSDDDFRQKAKLSSQIEEAVPAVATGIMKTRPVGWTGKVETQTGQNISVHMSKMATKSVLEVGVTVGDFNVSALGSVLDEETRSRVMNCASGIEATSIHWPGNIKGYAGSKSTAGVQQAAAAGMQDGASALAADPEATDAGSGANCCETSDKVQSTELESCGVRLQVKNLTKPITFTLAVPRLTEDIEFETHDASLRYESVFVVQKEVRFCQFWDNDKLQWSGEGCVTTVTAENHLECACTHLSTFSGAWGETFGRLGKNRADILLKTPKVDFAHGPFIVVLVWALVLYTPCFYFLYRDFKDYPWLSDRKELFKEKYPKGSNDLLCMVCPGCRIWSGIIMLLPVFINVSKLERRVKWVFTGGMFRWLMELQRRRKESQELTDFQKESSQHDQHWVGFFNAEVWVDGIGEDCNHLLWSFTEPPLRESMYRIVMRANSTAGTLSRHLGFAGGHGMRGWRKNNERMKRKLFNQALAGVRNLNWNRPPVKLNIAKDVSSPYIGTSSTATSSRGRKAVGSTFSALKDFSGSRSTSSRFAIKREERMYSKVTSSDHVFGVQVWDYLLDHLTAQGQQAKTQESTKQGIVKKARNSMTTDNETPSLSKLDNRQKVMTDYLNMLMKTEKVEATYSQAPLLPPLHSMLADIKVNSSKAWHDKGGFGETSLQPGTIVFVWQFLSDDSRLQMAFHRAQHLVAPGGGTGVWLLAPWMRTVIVDVPQDGKVKVSETVADSEEEVQLDIPVEGGGSLLLALHPVYNFTWRREYFETSVNHLASWCDSLRVSGWPERDSKSNDLQEVTLQTRPFGWVARSRIPGRGGFPLSARVTRGVKRAVGLERASDPQIASGRGLILADVTPQGQAESLGLQAGSVLHTLGGRKVARCSTSAIALELYRMALPIVAVFRKPIEPDLVLVLEESAFSLPHTGMVVKPPMDYDLGHADGLRHGDEIITIEGEPCYDALGDQMAAEELFKSARSRARHSGSLMCGILRPGAGQIPAALVPICGLPSIFCYRPGTSAPHTAAGPFVVQALGSKPAFLCKAWFSHCGMAISLLPIRWPRFCLGMYLQDVDDMLVLSPSALNGDALISDALTSSRDLDHALTHLWRIQIQLLAMAPTSGKQSDSGGLVIGCDSRWTMHRFVASLSRARKRSTNTVLLKNGVEASQAVVGYTHRLGEEKKEESTPQLASADSKAEAESAPRRVMSHHRSAYLHTMGEYSKQSLAWNVQPHEVSAKEVAAKMTYHFWSKQKVAQTILYREHIVPKLFKHMPPLTRVERWAILSSACQSAFFWLTFFFRPDCQMQPKPAKCTPPRAYMERFLPTLVTLFASVFGLLMSVPVPLILSVLFRKTPVMEILSPKEKVFRLRTWRFFTTCGWCFAVGLHCFVMYFLTMFTNTYDWPVFEKWFISGILSVIHRFLTAPLVRGLVFAFILLGSRFIGIFDHFFTFVPQILPQDQLAHTDSAASGASDTPDIWRLKLDAQQGTVDRDATTDAYDASFDVLL